MKDLVLKAQKRTSEENSRDLRASRIVPAVVYGKTQESLSLKIDASDLLRMYRTAGESHIILLDVEGEKEKIEVLIHDSQKEPVSGEFIHMDFFALTRGEKLTTKISLNFINDSAAVKAGALLNENVKEIEVSCLPRDLVDSFEVDLSQLKEIEDVIRLSDLGIDTEKFDVHNLHDEDAIVVAGKPAKIEDLDAPIETPDLPEGAEEKTDDAAAEETKEA
ncbi:50S ribosomal protein L25 [Candidatus Gracilibacteria bacterium]|nr:50S ribosomal protein L25 [Candidatus Gracilibacteria bacterium]